MPRAPHQQTDSVASTLPLEPEPFRKALSTWYRKHARELPWRGVRNPYGTWLSEIMLQQTRVATVVERYVAFLERFPSLADLAAAPEDDVLALWSGLGYYRRARMLHRGAQFVVRELNGLLPETAIALRTLPGVGEYTAAAIASIAFGQSVAVLDGNVERVLLRLLGRPEEKHAAARKLLLTTANQLVPPAPLRRGKTNPPGDHNQAMMELGATVCLPRNPLCLHCPVFGFCRTRGEHTTGPRAALRSRHIACLLTTRKHGTVSEVLLERRSPEASLMPGMLELPPLPLDATTGREPVLRLRHGITNTNYYVEIYTEAAPGLATDEPTDDDDGSDDPASPNTPSATTSPSSPTTPASPNTLDNTPPQALPLLPFAGPPPPSAGSFHPPNQQAATSSSDLLYRPTLSSVPGVLRSQIPAAPADLLWCPLQRLYRQPLTGLTRKTLQRMGLMPMHPVRIKDAGAV